MDKEKHRCGHQDHLKVKVKHERKGAERTKEVDMGNQWRVKRTPGRGNGRWPGAGQQRKVAFRIQAVSGASRCRW